MLIVMERLEQVEIFDFHMLRHNVQFYLWLGSPTRSINQLVTHINSYFSKWVPRTSSP